MVMLNCPWLKVNDAVLATAREFPVKFDPVIERVPALTVVVATQLTILP